MGGCAVRFVWKRIVNECVERYTDYTKPFDCLQIRKVFSGILSLYTLKVVRAEFKSESLFKLL